MLRSKAKLRQFVLVSTAMMATYCGRGSSYQSSTEDLNPGPNSNIAEVDGNRTLTSKDIDILKVLPNTKVPKGLLVSLVGSSTRNGNYQFVKDLYNIIYDINVSNQLVRTIGQKVVDDNMRYNQQITLVVITDLQSKNLYPALLKDLAGGSSAPVPFIDQIPTPASYGDFWIQDFGEIAVTHIKKSDDWAYTILDTYRNKNRGIYDPKVFSDMFKVPFIRLGNDTDNASQYGGNIEATASGRLYMGDSVNSGDYAADGKKSPIFAQLKDLGNPDAFLTSSDWLVVGHTDEFMSVIPSLNSCGSAIIAGHALLAFDLLLNSTTDADFQYFADELSELPIAFDKYGYPTKTLDVVLTKANLVKALAYFKKDGTTTISQNIDDYDLGKADPFWLKLTSGVGISWNDFSKFTSDFDEYAKFYVWKNLQDMSKILPSAAAVAQGSCAKVSYIPQLFIQNFDYYAAGRAVYFYKDSAHLPGMTNLIALRDKVILPDTWLQSFRDYTRNVMLQHLGDETTTQKVYFINDDIYHFALGEVHCATNPIREIDMDYQF